MPIASRRTLLPYAIVILFAFIGFALPLPILPEMFLDPKLSIVPNASLRTKMILLGLMMASFPLGQFFGAPMLGSLSDRYGRKKTILWSLFGAALGYGVIAYSASIRSVGGMFMGLAICGFSEGNVTIAQSVVADLTENTQEKARHFGWINLFISLGFIIGPFMGGVLADPRIVSWFTFATPFWMAGCLTLCAILMIALCAKETLRRGESTSKAFVFKSLWHGVRQPTLKRYYLANFFLALGYFSYFRFLPVFLEHRFDFSVAELSYAIVYDSIAIGAGSLWLVPWLAKKASLKKALSLFSFLLALCLVGCLLPTTPWALIATIPPVGLCLAVVMTKGALLISNSASRASQGQAMGTLTGVQVLAEIVTGLFGGGLAAHLVELPLYGGVVMMVIGGMIVLTDKVGSKRES